MAVSSILSRFGAPATLTLSLAPSGVGLASSTSGLVARQATFVDNSAGYGKIHLFFKIKAGTTPTANRAIYPFLLKADKFTAPTTATDGAGTTDAAITIVSAEQLLASGPTTATTGQVYQWPVTIFNPGPAWSIAIGHDMVAALDATGANHVVTWIGEYTEAQ